AVRLEALRLRGEVVATGVGGHHAKARRCKRLDLQPPTEPELREPVQQDDQRPIPCLDVMQAHIADLGDALLELDPNVRQLADLGQEVHLRESRPWPRDYARRPE